MSIMLLRLIASSRVTFNLAFLCVTSAMLAFAVAAVCTSLVEGAWHMNSSLFQTSHIMDAFIKIKDYEREFGQHPSRK